MSFVSQIDAGPAWTGGIFQRRYSALIGTDFAKLGSRVDRFISAEIFDCAFQGIGNSKKQL